MDQRNLDFSSDESSPIYEQLDKQSQRSLIDLMAALIISAFNGQEKKHHERIYQPNKNKR